MRAPSIPRSDHNLGLVAVFVAITAWGLTSVIIKSIDMNAIAIEELQHFDQVLDLLASRSWPLLAPMRSPWISGMMSEVRKGRRHQVIDHLVVCSLIEGRSCEKFQILAEGVRDLDSGALVRLKITTGQ